MYIIFAWPFMRLLLSGAIEVLREELAVYLDGGK
jgi:hypothetical protein